MIDVRRRVEEIIAAFIEKEADLLINNVSEQAITHRLANMLECEFSEWQVDCEYNRDQSAIKRLKYAISPEHPVAEKEVVPDIIIHERMSPNNFIVFEIKKSTNPETDDKDLAKLHAFIEQLGYQHACFVRFLVGTTDPGIQRLKWI